MQPCLHGYLATAAGYLISKEQPDRLLFSVTFCHLFDSYPQFSYLFFLLNPPDSDGKQLLTGIHHLLLTGKTERTVY